MFHIINLIFIYGMAVVKRPEPQIATLTRDRVVVSRLGSKSTMGEEYA